MMLFMSVSKTPPKKELMKIIYSFVNPGRSTENGRTGSRLANPRNSLMINAYSTVYRQCVKHNRYIIIYLFLQFI